MSLLETSDRPPRGRRRRMSAAQDQREDRVAFGAMHREDGDARRDAVNGSARLFEALQTHHRLDDLRYQREPVRF